MRRSPLTRTFAFLGRAPEADGTGPGHSQPSLDVHVTSLWLRLLRDKSFLKKRHCSPTFGKFLISPSRYQAIFLFP